MSNPNTSITPNKGRLVYGRIPVTGVCYPHPSWLTYKTWLQIVNIYKFAHISPGTGHSMSPKTAFGSISHLSLVHNFSTVSTCAASEGLSSIMHAYKTLWMLKSNYYK